MKKIIIPVFTILCTVILINKTSAQVQFFDSVKTVVSSSIYDYKNPVFNNEYRGISDYSWLVYERHYGNSSDIVVRKARYSSYDSEIVLTHSTNALNINPTIDHGMLVWQSNARGNWDLYYSIFIYDSSWSAPVLLDSSAGDKTNPHIRYNNIGGAQYNSYLVYKRNNSLWFKRYKSTPGVWDNDTMITDGTYEDINPVIIVGDYSNEFGIVFQRKYSASVSKLDQRIFYDNNINLPVSWENVYEIYQPNSQNNLSMSFASSEILTYSYDTLNSTHIIGFGLNGQSIKGVISKNVPGKHLSGKGSAMGIITDDVYYFFSAFSVLSRNSDSLFFTFINRPSTFNEFPEYKKVYLGDTNVVTRFDVSQPVFHLYYYRIKTVWEKTSGARTSLVESYTTDFLDNATLNTSEAGEFYLSQNYPNPFNPVTHLRFGISNPGFVSLKVYDALGREVSTIVNESLSSGSYEAEFNGSNFPSGIYYYRLQSGEYKDTGKMLLIK